MKRFVFILPLAICFNWTANAQELPHNMRRSPQEVLGTISPDETDMCVVQGFADPYLSMKDVGQRKEFRWRIRVPNGSTFNIAWATQKIPAEGFPKAKDRMISPKSPLPSAMGDVVIVVRADGRKEPTLEISVFGEFPQNLPHAVQDPNGKEIRVFPDLKNASYYNAILINNAKWLPYWKETKPKLENLDRREPVRIEPSGNHWLMKHVIEKEGEQEGFGIWLEFK